MITKAIEGMILKRIGLTTQLKKGKFRRELYMDHGNQKFVVDEIVELPEDFTELEEQYPYDVIIYLNGLEKISGERMNRFSLKSIRPQKVYPHFDSIAKRACMVILLIGISFAAPAQPAGIFDFLKKERTGREHVAQQGKNKFRGYHKMKFTKGQLSGLQVKKGGAK